MGFKPKRRIERTVARVLDQQKRMQALIRNRYKQEEGKVRRLLSGGEVALDPLEWEEAHA